MTNWFELKKPDQVSSPALLVYKSRVEQNISYLLKMVGGDASRLIPHVKTHKLAEVVQLQIEAGISKFKCATIAEAEMVARAGGKWVLIAYQLIGPNIERLLQLASSYPEVQFGVLVDNRAVAKYLNDQCKGRRTSLLVFIDINSGMNRTGHAINSELLALYEYVYKLPNLLLTGIHVYDGHIRDQYFKDRKAKADEEFEKLQPLLQFIEMNGFPAPIIIAGGTPTFTVHSRRPGVYCSPGTFVFSDVGYGDLYKEQPFVHAAAVMTRIISKPETGYITIDLGHKAVAAEMPLEKRFILLNVKEYTIVSQSEEHCVLKVAQPSEYHIGDVLYAIPYHICPTVALHQSAIVIKEGEIHDEWEVIARNRQIKF